MVSVHKRENGIVACEAISENESLRLTCKGAMEFDGRLSYDCIVTAKKNIHLQDIRLEIPYRKDIAEYMIGMGRMEGYTPEFGKSIWRREEESFWLGNAKGSLHCELCGGSYHGSLLNLYQLNHPRSWYNGVNGGFRIDTKNETVEAMAYSGYRPMQEGEEVTNKFALIVSPAEPYNPNDQWKYKYEHNPKPRKEVVVNGRNMMNVHHANKYNRGNCNCKYEGIDQLGVAKRNRVFIKKNDEKIAMICGYA
ncbi:glycoside hydrolase domain-containing protein [uncultured Sunxiuqinia sp.]|uniref:glycoside hydrolase domain-containing protein n=1 Tax=uncultured Sunxiuqinia sp. TaxID=1573825 RepID=UPI002608925D|nr:glycoside hydrolase domain-containing protein [uncultured Sunxiuqinia sp.]